MIQREPIGASTRGRPEARSVVTRIAPALCAFLAVLFLCACGDAPVETPQDPASPPASATPAEPGARGAALEPHIVLVSIDSLRADRLGCYGAKRETSPAIDAVAGAGARFENAVAPSPWTLPSHVTLLTGLPVTAHRVGAPHRRIDSARTPLAVHLAANGYRTAGFVSSPFLDPLYGIDRGFDVYRNFQTSSEFPPSEGDHERSHSDRSADDVVDAAIGWLAELPGDRPGFLFVHVWDVHYDYTPPPPFDTMFDPTYAGDLDVRRLKYNPAISARMSQRDLAYLQAQYDGEIRWVDSQLARLFRALEATEAARPVLLSIVSDHGEEFFEHGQKGHFKALYEESVRVPWIIRYPGVVPPDTRIGGIAGLEDVAPTLLGLARLPPLEEATGTNLAHVVVEGRDAPHAQLMSFGYQRALRGAGWKITLRGDTGEGLFYDLVRDPGEHDPRPAREAAPRRLAKLRQRLKGALDHGESLRWVGDGEADLDEATAARLRELGYLE